MRPETAVVHAYSHNVHTEYYANPAARKTIILVNGSLATTASFAHTIKYLTPQFNVALYDPVSYTHLTLPTIYSV